MKRISLFLGGVLGGLSALVVVAFTYLANLLFGLPQFVFALFDWLSRHLPGSLLTLFIDTMVTVIASLHLGATAAVAKLVEQTLAVILFVVLAIILGIVLVIIARRRPDHLEVYGIAGGIVLALLFIGAMFSAGFPAGGPVLSILWTAFALMFAGWLLARSIQALSGSETVQPANTSRRQFLWVVGSGSVAVLVGAAGARLITANSAQSAATAEGGGVPPTGGGAASNSLPDASNTSGPAQSPSKSALDARFPTVPGERPELTPTAQFYRIDVNTIVPQVDENTWRLQVGGLVDKPLSLTLSDLRSRPPVSQAITQECISNPVGGDLISTGVYTGVPLKTILQEAGLKPGAQSVRMEAVDTFYESMPIEEAMDERTLLVYELNHAPLAAEHGFPVRVYIPDHFGMKQPKWLMTLTVLDHLSSGFWEDRGWDARAIPTLTSVIDTADVQNLDPKTGILPVWGIAYAGARGISTVEVQVDQGPWQAAELRNPPLSPLTWVQWRYSWKAQPGPHTFRVRATDGAGQPQIVQPAPPEPGGATGIHSVSQYIYLNKKS